MRVLPAGERAVLAEFDSLREVGERRAVVAERPITGVVEIVGGARTLLLRFDPTMTDAGAVARAISALAPPAAAADATPTTASAVPGHGIVDVPVIYDGDDLAAVAELTGLGIAGVVREHTARVWTSAFCGFAPGFSYLSSDGPSLDVPRRATPRTAVPAGAVALAGEFSAVYPRRSPGGWQLIGRTSAAMWDVQRTPPALLPPGTRVRFVEAAG
ncbi:allophanate hydrolase subunit 1 [Gryllotalpicola reticulitermitis]|uniref:Allophanate hydrolase subunit 1 n=1 Tax=Gryllotalpicola reticulitermitis TaxID=1184153 RepID=A0ABV8Q6Z9_9MICO